MLRRIKLYGRLAKFIGKRVLYADVSSAAEAVRFLVANWPEVREHMADQYYRVFVGKRNITQEELHVGAGDHDIRIVPVVAGAGGGKTGGILGIVIGVALIAASIFIPGSALIWGTQFGALSLGVGVVGGAMVLLGTASLLSPTPQLGGGLFAGSPSSDGGGSSMSDKKKRGDVASQNFNGIANVTRSGLPISLIYGEVATGTLVVSSGIDVDDKKKKS